METPNYSPPVDQLLTYGDCREIKEMPDYPGKFGLTEEHIPDLIRMATDPKIAWADSESLVVWANIHAWRALGQLRAEAAIEPLISLFWNAEEDDWVMEEMPEVFGNIGTAAIPALTAYLQKKSNHLYPRSTAATCLTKIAQQFPEVRSECITILAEQLDARGGNDEAFNGFLVNDLLNLKAVEVASTIQQAYEEQRVELFAAGDWNDVQVELGLKTRQEILAEEATRPNFSHRLRPEQKAERSAKGGFGTSKTASKTKKKKKKKR